MEGCSLQTQGGGAKLQLPLAGPSGRGLSYPSACSVNRNLHNLHRTMHQTVLLRGQDPLLSIERCTVCCIKYHCAYCKLGFNHLHELQNHVTNHMQNAVQQEDFTIIKCGLNCRPSPHFHCCYCTSTVIRRDGIIKHFKTCKNTASGQPPLPAAPPASAAPPPSPASAAPPPSSASAAPPPSPAAPPLSPASAAPPPKRLCVRQQIRVTCTHCGIQINQRNLLVHINRRHRQRVTDITAKQHL
ncbi:zinc finger protein 414-like [Triplophysa rosa]|uniref:zinc finger protein 414-like n=1 Tax=Triplophysa rosa TaxID=992332 RepID=UPI002545D699|nr:zinc finger protein 414-like [Triplophysa rosa]